MDKPTFPENRNVTEGTITFNFQKFLCRIKWHDWEAWADVELTYTYPTTGKEVQKAGQKRHCKECNIRQVRIDS